EQANVHRDERELHYGYPCLAKETRDQVAPNGIRVLSGLRGDSGRQIHAGVLRRHQSRVRAHATDCPAFRTSMQSHSTMRPSARWFTAVMSKRSKPRDV